MALMKYKNADGTIGVVASPNDHEHQNKDILDGITSNLMLNSYYICLRGTMDTSGSNDILRADINLLNGTISNTMINAKPVLFIFSGTIKVNETRVFFGTLVGQLQWYSEEDDVSTIKIVCDIEHQGKKFIFKPTNDTGAAESWTVAVEDAASSSTSSNSNTLEFWQPGKDYKIGDTVIYVYSDNGVWRMLECCQDHTSAVFEDEESNYWSMLAIEFAYYTDHYYSTGNPLYIDFMSTLQSVEGNEVQDNQVAFNIKDDGTLQFYKGVDGEFVEVSAGAEFEVDTIPTQGSNNPISSDAVFNYCMKETNFIETTAETIELINNNCYVYGEITTLTATLPVTRPNGYISGIVFTSGATIPTLTISGDVEIKFDGEDCLDESFVPQTNKTYQVTISKVGSEIWADVDARGV